LISWQAYLLLLDSVFSLIRAPKVASNDVACGRFQKRIKLYYITVCCILLSFTWFGCHKSDLLWS